MRSNRTLALRRELLTELSDDELRVAAAAAPGPEDGTSGGVCNWIIVGTQIGNILLTIFGEQPKR